MSDFRQIHSRCPGLLVVLSALAAAVWSQADAADSFIVKNGKLHAEIVIAQKVGQEAKFERLSDQPNVDEILQDSHLGDAWYSGILGGVPCEQ